MLETLYIFLITFGIFLFIRYYLAAVLRGADSTLFEGVVVSFCYALAYTVQSYIIQNVKLRHKQVDLR